MDKLIEDLNRYFGSLKYNRVSNLEFWMSLADCVRFISQTEEINEAVSLLQKKKKDDFGEFEKDYKKIISKNPKISIYNTGDADFDNKKDFELWALWDKLYSVYLSVDKDAREEHLETIKKLQGAEKKWDETLLKSAIGILDEISKDGVHPDLRNYIFCAERIRNYLIGFLRKIKSSEEKDKDETNKKEASFDEDRSILEVAGESVKIQKHTDQYHLLRIMFENPDETSKEWFYSEIDELVGGGHEDKKYYNAAYNINKNVAIETGIKGFIITTNQSARINPSYLPKSS